MPPKYHLCHLGSPHPSWSWSFLLAMPMVSAVLRTSLTSSPVDESLTLTLSSSPTSSEPGPEEAEPGTGSLYSAGLSLSLSWTRFRGFERQ